MYSAYYHRMTNNKSILLIVIGCVALIIPSAFAQPSEVSSRNNAQHTTADDVATLNGQPVKVGEKNAYRTSVPEWNLAANPLGLVVGWYSVSAAKSLSNNVALRGGLTFLDDDNAFGMEVGIPLYFKKTFSGFFIEPGLGMFRDDGNTVFGGPSVVVGWHWMWDSNFNVALAAGIGRNWSSDSDFDEYYPAGYFQVGYAFGGAR